MYKKLKEKEIDTLKSMVSEDRFSMGSSNLDLHSRDQSWHTPALPEAVIWPVNKKEVSKILSFANDNNIPVTAWGAGTSLEGNPIPVAGGIVLDFSRMNQILSIRPGDFQADVEPGVIYQDLNDKLRHMGLFFPPDPGARATIGGMIANNASGTKTVRYGSTKDYVLRLEVVLANGEIIEIGTRASKTSSGYDLIHLFVGSEGTLGIVVEATIKLVGTPVAFSAAVVNFPSVEIAGKAVFELIRSGTQPAALELMAPECIELINREEGFNLEVSPTLFMEFHAGSNAQLEEVMEMVEDICREMEVKNFKKGIGREERDRLLSARHRLGEMIVRNHPDRSPFVIDVAVPISSYPEMITFARQEAKRIGIPGYTFSHAGDGNIHLVYVGKKGNDAEWKLIHESSERIVMKALSLDGTCTGEHGVGIGKRKYMEKEHGKSLYWMKRVKELFDPKGILNPMKIFP